MPQTTSLHQIQNAFSSLPGSQGFGFRTPFRLSVCLLALIASLLPSHAGEVPSPSAPPAEASTRYGLFDGLDHRSSYGLGVFPEPFLVDDSDLEVNEIRLDWLYTRGAGQQQNHAISPELEKGFGNLTVEVRFGYEIDHTPGATTRGWSSVKGGARYPLFQAISPGGFADTTFGVASEVGIPVNSAFSKNTEIVPAIFNDTKIGDFTLQTVLGYSMLLGGGGEDGGLHTFEYGFTLGYAIQRPLPAVEQFIPVFELSGARVLNKENAGLNTLLGNAGFRVNLKSIGRAQPRLGIGYVFPLNRGGLDQLQSGVFTSLVFDF